MDDFTADDASLLAILALSADVPADRRHLVGDLSTPYARQIGAVIVGNDAGGPTPSKKARVAAAALQQWAKDLDKYR
jgi:hypothetical protein